MGLEERIKYAAMKARHRRVLLPWYKKWWGLVLIALGVLIILFISWATLYIALKTRAIIAERSADPTIADYESYVKTINNYGANYYLGPLAAPVTIVEFGDFACPYCQASAEAIHQLNLQYPNQVKIVWRDYLLNENSIDLALSARCAGDQKKFWEMHDQLFAQQKEIESISGNQAARRNLLIELASNLDLEITKFTNCLDEKSHLTAIKSDYEAGNNLMINGTPTWFVNNFPISGTLIESRFVELIDGILINSDK